MNAVLSTGTVLNVNDAERKQARDVMAAKSDSDTFVIVIELDSKRLTVPTALAKCLTNVMASLANGGSTRIESLPHEMSTTVAARHLGISRPTLMKHVGSGALPAHKVGTHTRIRTKDLLDFRAKLLEQRMAAFEELRRVSDELGEE
jgi:excisionase family DNA binding protein